MRSLISMFNKGVLFLILVLGSQVAACKNANLDVTGIDQNKIAVFYQKLQKAISEKDKITVSKLVRYPIAVTVDGKVMSVRNEQQCIEYYDSVFNEVVISSISNTSFEKLSGSVTGISTSHGIVWFDEVSAHGNDIMIVTINNNMKITDVEKKSTN